jgi:hypothetical protein
MWTGRNLEADSVQCEIGRCSSLLSRQDSSEPFKTRQIQNGSAANSEEVVHP